MTDYYYIIKSIENNKELLIDNFLKYPPSEEISYQLEYHFLITMKKENFLRIEIVLKNNKKLHISNFGFAYINHKILLACFDILTNNFYIIDFKTSTILSEFVLNKETNLLRQFIIRKERNVFMRSINSIPYEMLLGRINNLTPIGFNTFLIIDEESSSIYYVYKNSLLKPEFKQTFIVNNLLDEIRYSSIKTKSNNDLNINQPNKKSYYIWYIEKTYSDSVFIYLFNTDNNYISIYEYFPLKNEVYLKIKNRLKNEIFPSKIKGKVGINKCSSIVYLENETRNEYNLFYIDYLKYYAIKFNSDSCLSLDEIRKNSDENKKISDMFYVTIDNNPLLIISFSYSNLSIYSLLSYSSISVVFKKKLNYTIFLNKLFNSNNTKTYFINGKKENLFIYMKSEMKILSIKKKYFPSIYESSEYNKFINDVSSLLCLTKLINQISIYESHYYEKLNNLYIKIRRHGFDILNHILSSINLLQVELYEVNFIVNIIVKYQMHIFIYIPRIFSFSLFNKIESSIEISKYSIIHYKNKEDHENRLSDIKNNSVLYKSVYKELPPFSIKFKYNNYNEMTMIFLYLIKLKLGNNSQSTKNDDIKKRRVVCTINSLLKDYVISSIIYKIIIKDVKTYISYRLIENNHFKNSHLCELENINDIDEYTQRLFQIITTSSSKNPIISYEKINNNENDTYDSVLIDSIKRILIENLSKRLKIKKNHYDFIKINNIFTKNISSIKYMIQMKIININDSSLLNKLFIKTYFKINNNQNNTNLKYSNYLLLIIIQITIDSISVLDIKQMIMSANPSIEDLYNVVNLLFILYENIIEYIKSTEKTNISKSITSIKAQTIENVVIKLIKVQLFLSLELYSLILENKSSLFIKKHLCALVLSLNMNYKVYPIGFNIKNGIFVTKILSYLNNSIEHCLLVKINSINFRFNLSKSIFKNRSILEYLNNRIKSYDLNDFSKKLNFHKEELLEMIEIGYFILSYIYLKTNPMDIYDNENNFHIHKFLLLLFYTNQIFLINKNDHDKTNCTLYDLLLYNIRISFFNLLLNYDKQQILMGNILLIINKTFKLDESEVEEDDNNKFNKHKLLEQIGYMTSFSNLTFSKRTQFNDIFKNNDEVKLKTQSEFDVFINKLNEVDVLEDYKGWDEEKSHFLYKILYDYLLKIDLSINLFKKDLVFYFSVDSFNNNTKLFIKKQFMKSFISISEVYCNLDINLNLLRFFIEDYSPIDNTEFTENDLKNKRKSNNIHSLLSNKLIENDNNKSDNNRYCIDLGDDKINDIEENIKNNNKDNTVKVSQSKKMRRDSIVLIESSLLKKRQNKSNNSMKRILKNESVVLDLPQRNSNLQQSLLISIPEDLNNELFSKKRTTAHEKINRISIKDLKHVINNDYNKERNVFDVFDNKNMSFELLNSRKEMINLKPNQNLMANDNNLYITKKYIGTKLLIKHLIEIFIQRMENQFMLLKKNSKSTVKNMVSQINNSNPHINKSKQRNTIICNIPKRLVLSTNHKNHCERKSFIHSKIKIENIHEVINENESNNSFSSHDSHSSNSHEEKIIIINRPRSKKPFGYKVYSKLNNFNK